MAGRSGVKVSGKRRLRRVLSQLPDDLREEVAAAMRLAGGDGLAIVKSLTPSRTGKLRRLMTWKVTGKKFPRLRIGLLTKKARGDGFYGRILERGRKAQTVTARRRKPGGGVATYLVRVKAIDRGAFDFIWGTAAPRVRNAVADRVTTTVDRVLKQLGSGSYGSD